MINANAIATSTYPYIAILACFESADLVITDRERIFWIVTKNFDFVAIIAIESITSTKPQKAVLILNNGANGIL